jgi:hypothetical protein
MLIKTDLILALPTAFFLSFLLSVASYSVDWKTDFQFDYSTK